MLLEGQRTPRKGVPSPTMCRQRAPLIPGSGRTSLATDPHRISVLETKDRATGIDECRRSTIPNDVSTKNPDPKSRTASRAGALVGFASLLLCFAACDESAADAPTCAELAPDCAATQQVCVEADAGPVCEFCPDGSFIGQSGACEEIGGQAISHAFPAFEVEPGEEIKDLCQSWTLNNAEELWVSAVEMRQNYGSHHSIWTFVPDDVFDGPDGVWVCDDRGASIVAAVVAGGNLYNQSTQAEHETQRFADDAAIRIPPYSRVVGEMHLLNATTEILSGNMNLTLYAQEKEEVGTPLVPVELTFDEVFVPAESESRMVAECEIADSFAEVDAPVDFTVYHVMPHAHERGRRLFIEVVGGPMDGTSILNDVHYATYEPRGYNFQEPLRIEGATALRYGCEFDNPDPWDYVWGFKEEMCQFSMFVDSPLALTGSVSELEDVGMADGMQTREGRNCRVVSALWNHDKPGGPGPAKE